MHHLTKHSNSTVSNFLALCSYRQGKPSGGIAKTCISISMHFHDLGQPRANAKPNNTLDVVSVFILSSLCAEKKVVAQKTESLLCLSHFFCGSYDD